MFNGATFNGATFNGSAAADISVDGTISVVLEGVTAQFAGAAPGSFGQADYPDAVFAGPRPGVGTTGPAGVAAGSARAGVSTDGAIPGVELAS